MKVICNWPEARVVMALGLELKPGENEVSADIASAVLALDGVEPAAAPVAKKIERGARIQTPEEK